jgi:hypothetical protein
MWIDAGLPTVLKALMNHPETRHLDIEEMTKIACTMIYRFGTNEGESVEEGVASLFSPDELVKMTEDLVSSGDLKDGPTKAPRKSKAEKEKDCNKDSPPPMAGPFLPNPSPDLNPDLDSGPGISRRCPLGPPGGNECHSQGRISPAPSPSP